MTGSVTSQTIGAGEAVTPEQQVECAVNHALNEKLKAARAELLAEDQSVAAVLKDCKREKVQPAKDYWHKQKKLRDKVAVLEKLLTPARADDREIK